MCDTNKSIYIYIGIVQGGNMQPWQLAQRAALQAAQHQQRMAAQAQRDALEAARRRQEAEKRSKLAKDLKKRGPKM
jgi:hypothetical protein